MEEIIYHGETLKNAVSQALEDKEFLIDSLVPKESVTMFFANDGIGKSIISLQICLESASTENVFESFEVKKPLRIIYIPSERPLIEPFQRIKMMMNKINVNWENILIDKEMQGKDFTLSRHREEFVGRIAYLIEKKFKDGIDLLFIDPVYALISSGLVNEEGANCINSVIRKIQSQFGCAVAYNHHTNRGIRNIKTGKREEEDMYGGRFLRANCTGIYHIKNNGHGTQFFLEKDTYGCLAKSFLLEYDPQFFLSHLIDIDKNLQKKDKITMFLRTCFNEKKVFDFAEFSAAGGVSTIYSRIQLKKHLESGNIVCCNPNKKKHLYQVMKEEIDF